MRRMRMRTMTRTPMTMKMPIHLNLLQTGVISSRSSGPMPWYRRWWQWWEGEEGRWGSLIIFLPFEEVDSQSTSEIFWSFTPVRTTLVRLPLQVIACLCHDLDHRGTNNTFQVHVHSLPYVDLGKSLILFFSEDIFQVYTHSLLPYIVDRAIFNSPFFWRYPPTLSWRLCTAVKAVLWNDTTLPSLCVFSTPRWNYYLNYLNRYLTAQQTAVTMTLV